MPRQNRQYSTKGPTPIFKKRYDTLVNTQISNNITNGRVAQIQLRETGTVYTVKVCMKATQVAAAVGDLQQCDLFVIVEPLAGIVTDHTVEANVETDNGFYVGSLFPSDGDFSGANDYLLEKFRFRRKVDENMRITLVGTNLNKKGTGRSVDFNGTFCAVIRVR